MKSLFTRMTGRSLVVVSLLAMIAGMLQPPGARAQASYWIPPKDTVWQLQWTNDPITGDVLAAIKMAIIPLYTTNPAQPDAPQEQITDLHAKKIKAVCSLPAGVVNIVNDPDRSWFTQRMWGKGASYWQDQRWLDVRNTGVRKLIESRIAYAISIGCDAIEVQWVDGYIQDTGLPITYGDQLAFNRWLATTAHQHGIAIGLRNDFDQIADLEDWYDFAVADNCMGTAECELFAPFTDSGKPVFNVEYTSTSGEIHICNASAYYDFNTIIKTYGVDASWQKCN
jgi:hypothetical protein